MSLPYIEKYRPKVLDDVIGNQPIISRLKFFAHNGNLPNILIASPAGMGKSTTALCIGHEYLKEHFSEAFLELNASDERNASDIREKVKGFAERQISLPHGFQKLVFLDEADAMTGQAQLALRRVIEDFTKTTRFILCCNEISKISESLQSRCCVLLLETIKPEEISEKLIEISRQEKFKIEKEAADEIAKESDGDVRAAINELQSAAVLSNGDIKYANLSQVLDYLDDNRGIEILERTKTNLKEAISSTESLVNDGYTADEIMNMLHRACISNDFKISDLQRARALKYISSAGARIAGGINSGLQVSRVLAEISLIK